MLPACEQLLVQFSVYEIIIGRVYAATEIKAKQLCAMVNETREGWEGGHHLSYSASKQLATLEYRTI